MVPANEIEALLEATKSVLSLSSFEETAKKLFSSACRLTGAKSGYVALLSDDGSENEVLFLEAGGMPCSVDPNLPMPIRGLRETAYRENRVVYDNDFMKSEWVKLMPEGHVELRNVMFAPLVIEGKTRGIMGLANKDSDFTDRDAKLAGGLGELAAISLRNSRAKDELDKTVTDLKKALQEVKTLRGIIPVCSYCKKMRDDTGSWDNLETYISEHSDVLFSHGACPECQKKVEDELEDK